MKHILSYGGGLNSTALLVYLVKNKLPLDLVLFADTGNEWPYTYETVRFYQKWSPVPFVTVHNNYGKSLYDYCYDKKIIPSRFRRDCTTKFKILPMRRYLREKYGKKEIFTRYVGIDYSESHRMRDSDRRFEINSYPLVDNKIDREGCKAILENEGLPIPEKSGCWFCIFNKKDNWVNMNPELFSKAVDLETNSKRYPQDLLLKGIPLLKLKDSIVNQRLMTEFEPEPNCDVAGSCFL